MLKKNLTFNVSLRTSSMCTNYIQYKIDTLNCNSFLSPFLTEPIKHIFNINVHKQCSFRVL